MSRYLRQRTPEGTYFFTVVTYHRQPILCQVEAMRCLLSSIGTVRRRLPFEMEAWVILPDHLHCIWSLPEGDADYSRRWALIKLQFTKAMGSSLSLRERSASRIKRHEGAIWQRRFWEHQIRDAGDFEAHVHYIHFNAVRHGLVRKPVDWPHSSFQRFVKKGVYRSDWGGLDDWPVDVGGE